MESAAALLLRLLRAGRERGRSTIRRGYWGDIVASPYHALAGAAYVPTDTEAAASRLAVSLAEEPRSSGLRERPAAEKAEKGGSYAHQLFDIMSRLSGSEQHRHHAVELATYNVLSWLWELEAARPYVMRAEHDIYSGLEGSVPRAEHDSAEAAPPGDADSARNEAPPAAAAPETEASAASTARVIARAFSGVRISLLCGEADEWLLRGRLGREHTPLHVISLSSRAVHLLDPARRPAASALPFADLDAPSLSAPPAASRAAAAAADGSPSAASLLAALAAPEGCCIVAETARNVSTLTAAQAGLGDGS